MANSLKGRALHYVFKIADRALAIKFFKDVLGMKVLRHEEFTEGCEAACNGPYDNRWSKTMVGYGFEDTHFVMELTYNYNVDTYEKGNEFLGITIRSREVIARAKATRWPITQDDEKTYSLQAPGGFQFFIIDDPQPQETDPVEKISLACSVMDKTINYWHCELGFNILERDHHYAVFSYGEKQAKIQFLQIGEPIERGTAFGRLAFAIASIDLPSLEKRMKDKNLTILTPLITLETPGKATVTVIILADPDGHEICFVDEESFHLLSEFDPQADVLLLRYLRKDAERKGEGKSQTIVP
ncbi:glyoxalase domain-containing protein 4 isoform X2 [Rhodnius prolixus]